MLKYVGARYVGTLCRSRLGNGLVLSIGPLEGALLCVLLMTLVTGCTRSSHESELDLSSSEFESQKLTSVETDVVIPTLIQWPTKIDSQGTLVAWENATLGSNVGGRIESVAVDLGSFVEKGDLLIEIDATEFELAVEQARARLSQSMAVVGADGSVDISQISIETTAPVLEAKATLDAAQKTRQRLRELRKTNAIAQTDLETAEANFEVAKAQLDTARNSVRTSLSAIRVAESALRLAEQRLAECRVRAPFTGVVDRRLVSPGQIISAGDPVVALAKTDQLRFRGRLPERYSTLLQRGQAVSVDTDNGMPSAELTVDRISPQLDLRTRSLMFESTVPNAGRKLRSGMFAMAEITVEPDALVLAVPESSVISFAGVSKVWKIVDGLTEVQIVSIGRRENGWVEITNGLEERDIILHDGEMGQVNLAVNLKRQLKAQSANVAVAPGAALVQVDAVEHLGGSKRQRDVARQQDQTRKQQSAGSATTKFQQQSSSAQKTLPTI